MKKIQLAYIKKEITTWSVIFAFSNIIAFLFNGNASIIFTVIYCLRHLNLLIYIFIQNKHKIIFFIIFSDLFLKISILLLIMLFVKNIDIFFAIQATAFISCFNVILLGLLKKTEDV